MSLALGLSRGSYWVWQSLFSAKSSVSINCLSVSVKSLDFTAIGLQWGTKLLKREGAGTVMAGSPHILRAGLSPPKLISMKEWCCKNSWHGSCTYIKHVTCKTKMWWKHVKRSSGHCRGSMTADLQRKNHNHAPDETQIHLARVRWIKDQAANTRGKPAQVFSHGVSQCEDDMLTYKLNWQSQTNSQLALTPRSLYSTVMDQMQTPTFWCLVPVMILTYGWQPCYCSK